MPGTARKFKTKVRERIPPAAAEPIVDLYAYQRRVHQSKAQFRLWRWSRQIGKSFNEALGANLGALERKRRQLMLSASQMQSDELMAKVHQHAEAQKIMADSIAENVVVDGITLTMHKARLVNGVEIITIPANPRTARGFTGDVWLDEFAMHQHDRDIWAAVFPSITRGAGRLTVASTPKGKQNLFYKLHENPNFEQSLVTIYDAVKDGYPADPEALRAGIDDEEIWRQEYLCEFVDEATAYLTYEMIQACETYEATANLPAEFVPQGDLYAGLDIGRKHDLTVLWLLELLGDVLWTRAVIELRAMPFRAQMEVFRQIFAMPKLRRACVDATGLGMQMAEELQARHGRYKVEGVTFTAAVKEELAGGLRVRVEDRLIRIPVDSALRNDWHSVKKVQTAAGNIRFDADRSEQGHADKFWAGALAVHAAGGKGKGPRIFMPFAA